MGLGSCKTKVAGNADESKESTKKKPEEKAK